jgi:hypothetical protein
VIPKVVTKGYHDVHFRWDVSTPERVVARLSELPGRGSATNPGKKLFAETNRFGKWQHLLGPRHVMVLHVVDSPTHGLIRRLEVQAHLGPDGEDDLCTLEDFSARWLGLQKRMAMMGVLPATEPRVTRVDVAVDLEFGNPSDGFGVLEGLKHARYPNGWYSEYQGEPPYTTVAIKSGRKTIGRVYCRNTKLGNGKPKWGKLRFEREQLFRWLLGRPVSELENSALAPMIWESVFGHGQVAGKVVRLATEVVTMKLIERVVLGEIGYAQFERMNAYLTAERLGLVDKAYTPDQARTRKREAKELGLSPADAECEYPEFDADLDEMLTVARSAWSIAS